MLAMVYGLIRQQLLSLAGKKLVVWCLSVREFTEGQGWGKVPIVR